MTTARYGAAGVALSDGRVLVAGGDDASGNATASAEVYDSSTNTWTPVAPMASARAFAAAAPLPGDRVLVAGGAVAGAASSSAEIFDGTTDTWSPAAPMEVARDGAVAAALPDGTVWVAGGSDWWPSELYNPASNGWSASYSFENVTGATAVSFGADQVFVAGGYDPDGLLWPAMIQSFTTGDASGGAMVSLYEAAASPLPGERVLLAGGSFTAAGPTGLTAVEVIDPQSFSWSPVAPMATARYGAIAAPLPDGRILVAGGEGASSPLASAEAFSLPVPTNTSAPAAWDTTPPTPVRVGDLLHANEGSWAPSTGPAPTYSSQWQRCLATCVDVGAPSASGAYVVTAADIGASLRVLVTMEDADGTGSPAASNQVGPVAPPGVHLDESWTYSLATQNGTPTLTVNLARDVTNGGQTVSYAIFDPAARGSSAFKTVTGTATFGDGQGEAWISLPVLDPGGRTVPANLEVQLYGGSPLPVVAPSSRTIDVAGDPNVRDPANPLALPSARAGNPLAGASFFDDFLGRPGRSALALSASDPGTAAALSVIARQPNVERFGAWDGATPLWAVQYYLQQAEREAPGTVPMISTYRLVDGHCTGDWSDPPADQLAYHDWIVSLAEGINTQPAVLFLEMDSLITAGCLSPQGVTVRMHELHDAIDILSNDPHLVVYLDAGAADALPARRAASLLRRAGVSQIQGFFLNSTHFDWTSREIRYGEEISRLTGGKHFVINTAENGQGPLRARHPATEGNEVLCDPPGRGLGPLPTTSTGYRNVDAFAWIANPGVSGGSCRPGAPPSGVFWPALALELVRHADFRVR